MFSYREYSGKHLILDINQTKKNDHTIESTTNLMKNICSMFCLNICSIVHKQFGDNPQAYTILFLLSESHFSVHTFPEKKTVAIDLYTCKEMSNNIMGYIASLINEGFDGTADYQVIERRLHPFNLLKHEREV